MVAKTVITEQEAFAKLSALCACAEYCKHDLRKKMSKWTLTEEEVENVINRLEANLFVDETRYAHAFVRDKFRYNHWGRVRITQQLRLKGIDQELINDALTEIDDEDNLDSLRHLIENKRHSVKGKSDYEINAKLFRFALSRGFSYDDINKVLHTDFDEE